MGASGAFQIPEKTSLPFKEKSHDLEPRGLPELENRGTLWGGTWKALGRLRESLGSPYFWAPASGFPNVSMLRGAGDLVTSYKLGPK